MKIKDLLGKAKNELEIAQFSEPRASAEALLCDVLGMSRTELLASLEQEISAGSERKFWRFIKRRKAHEPVWQIIGKVTFFGRSFLIDKNVLVPRPETEMLIEEVLKNVKRSQKLQIVDIGTGSGTVAVTLAAELEKRKISADITATDISSKALKIAKKNAKRLAPKAKINFKKSDLFSAVKGKFNIITANLPYIPHEEMQTLSLDVYHYEPRIALDGGYKGLEIYERFFKELPNYLEPGGMACCEIGHNQGENIVNMGGKAFPNGSVELVQDLAGKDRIVIIKT